MTQKQFIESKLSEFDNHGKKILCPYCIEGLAHSMETHDTMIKIFTEQQKSIDKLQSF